MRVESEASRLRMFEGKIILVYLAFGKENEFGINIWAGFVCVRGGANGGVRVF